LETLPDPTPGPDDVLIAVRAASVNFPDLLVIAGTYQNLPATPFVPGKDLAGTVTAVGTNVSTVSPGERVTAQIEYGAFAERAIISSRNCYPLPARMSFAEGAAMGLVYLTAHFALMERGGLKAGEIVLVNGAAGGVGLAAVQVAKACGATVVASVGSDEKAALARANGADHVVRTDVAELREDFRRQIFTAVGRAGVDLVIDPVGGDVFDASLRAIAWCGRIVTVGYASGRVPEVKAGLLLVKNISLVGLQVSDYRDRTPEKFSRVQRDLIALYEAGKLKPHVMACYPLESFREALLAVAERRALGKVVLDTSLGRSGTDGKPG
ncbi:MAG TPA: NADPH:quinone oxidoreductase family protein, partial [Burkholderiales bacterium]|nr:NADPH:quinone oxidoreductase family protein [Burkholderiales bacterium]